MGQPSLTDDEPELKFPESLPHKSHERGHAILSTTVAIQKSNAKKNG